MTSLMNKLKQLTLVTSGLSDTFYIGNLKGVGRIYQKTFIDAYSKVAFSKLYTMKTAITAADMLNDKIFSFFEDQELPMLRILTNRGSGKVENHDDELYLVINNIEYAKRRSNIRKQMSSASVSTKRFCRSFIRLPLEREFIRI